MEKASTGSSFEEGNKKVHPVETQWHYPVMTKHGFEPVTKEGVGFVRSYVYEHPTTGQKIKVTTGYNIDHWEDVKTKKGGLWNDLESYLQK